MANILASPYSVPGLNVTSVGIVGRLYTVPSGSSSSDNQNQESTMSKDKVGLIVGLVVGLVCGLLLVIGIVVFDQKHKQINRHRRLMDAPIDSLPMTTNENACSTSPEVPVEPVEQQQFLPTPQRNGSAKSISQLPINDLPLHTELIAFD